MSHNKDEGRLARLAELTPLLRVTDQEPMCTYHNCAHFGEFEECYTHVHAYCEVFDEWYDLRIIRPFHNPPGS